MRVNLQLRKAVARRRGNLKQALHKKPVKLPLLDFLKKKNGNGKDSLKTK